LVGTKGQYRPGLKIDSIRIPSTVQTVLADRIDRLPTPEKHLLQTASAIGVIVPMALLSAVAGLPEDELHRHLSTLRSSEFLYESNLFPDLEYTFKHALTNEVVYGAMLHDHKSLLHARILSVLEDTSGEDAEENIETLAHHALRAELWEKAVTYSRSTGEKATSHSGFVEALSWYEQAFSALKHLRETRETLALEIDLHLDSRNVLFLLGDLPRVAEHLHKAESIAEKLGDQLRMARVLNFLNSYYGLAGDPERAIQFGQRALALPAAHDDPALNAVTNYYLGVAYNKMARYDEAEGALKNGMKAVDGDLRYERFGTTVVLSVILRSHFVQSLAMTGRFREGISYAIEGVRIAEEVNHPVSLIHMNCSLGVLYIFKGDFDKAIVVLERALGICEAASIPVYVPFVASRLGSAYANSGRISEGLRYLEQGVENSAAVGRAGFLSLSMAWLSEGYLLSDRIEEARKFGKRAFDVSQKHKERGHGALALKLLGDIALHQHPANFKEGESYYHQALSICDEVGMQPLKAHCHFGLSQVSRGMGAAAQSNSELSVAVNLYRSMEMTFWLALGEEGLKTLQLVSDNDRKDHS
jgi:tetratricopeptide (TPR) repeat protein